MAARGRARVRSASQRRRGHQENAPSSIGHRKEARKALRWSGWSRKTPGGVIPAFRPCGTKCGTNSSSYCIYWINGGEGGIRTPGPPEGTTDFESAPFGHSGTSPGAGRGPRAMWRIVGNRRSLGNVPVALPAPLSHRQASVRGPCRREVRAAPEALENVPRVPSVQHAAAGDVRERALGRGSGGAKPGSAGMAHRAPPAWLTGNRSLRLSCGRAARTRSWRSLASGRSGRLLRTGPASCTGGIRCSGTPGREADCRERRARGGGSRRPASSSRPEG